MRRELAMLRRTKGEKGVLEHLFPILMKEPSKLTEEELDMLLEAEEILHREVARLSRFVCPGLEKLKRYRARRNELDKLSTHELEEIQLNIGRSKAQALANDPNDENLPDLFFEFPPIDSDESIVYVLLLERKQAAEK